MECCGVEATLLKWIGTGGYRLEGHETHGYGPKWIYYYIALTRSRFGQLFWILVFLKSLESGEMQMDSWHPLRDCRGLGASLSREL